jgi:hypothetical protein
MAPPPSKSLSPPFGGLVWIVEFRFPLARASGQKTVTPHGVQGKHQINRGAPPALRRHPVRAHDDPAGRFNLRVTNSVGQLSSETT